MDDNLADLALMEIVEGRNPQSQSSLQYYFVYPGMIESPSESSSEARDQESPLSKVLLLGSTNCDPCSLFCSPSKIAQLRDMSLFLELSQIHMQPHIQGTLEPLVDYN